MQRSVDGEVISSTFDEPRITTFDGRYGMERARRLVEHGKRCCHFVEQHYPSPGA